MRLPDTVRESLRSTVKETIWLAVRYEPGAKPDICLFCTRRGGSTWLMEMIGADRGLLPLNQPLELLTPNLTPYQYRRLPKFDRGQIVHPDEQLLGQLAEYTDDLMAGRIRVNAPHAFWRRGFRLRADRLVLKICDAKPMMDWFDQRYDVDVVYLARHPIPQALSCIRNGWFTTTQAYLDNERYVADVMPGLRDYALQVQRDGSELERFVLNWVVENLYPLRRMRDRPGWLALSYEECVVDQPAVLERVRTRLQLDDIDRMRQAGRRASRSSGMSDDAARTAIERGDREQQITAWRQRVDAEDLRKTQEILDRFEVSLYTAAEPLPDWSGYRA